MSRLVEFATPELNALYDALPLRGKLGIICGRFDEWVRGNGAMQCQGCKNMVTEIGGVCGRCWLSELPTRQPRQQRGPSGDNGG